MSEHTVYTTVDSVDNDSNGNGSGSFYEKNVPIAITAAVGDILSVSTAAADAAAASAAIALSSSTAAAISETNASDSETAAAASAADAATSLSGLSDQAATATAQAAIATTQAGIATSAAATATTQATAASTSASNAATSAATAASGLSDIATSVTTAGTQASNAGASATAAAASASAAATSATAAAASAASIVGDAATATTEAAIATTQGGIATTQAGIATTKAGEAATSASNAATSAATAASGVSSISSSLSSATTAATNAAASATAAAGSATAAATSATTASSAAAKLTAGALSSSANLDTILTPGYYYTTSTITSNTPVAGRNWMLHVEMGSNTGTGVVKQTATDVLSTDSKSNEWVRTLELSGFFTPWRRVAFFDEIGTAGTGGGGGTGTDTNGFNVTTLTADTDLDTITAPGTYYMESPTAVNSPVDGHYWLLEVEQGWSDTDYNVQVATDGTESFASQWVRVGLGSGSFTPWRRVAFFDEVGGGGGGGGGGFGATATSSAVDLDTLTTPGMYYNLDNSSTNTPDDTLSTTWMIRVEQGSALGDGYLKQTASDSLPFDNGVTEYIRLQIGGTWTPWSKVSLTGGAGNSSPPIAHCGRLSMSDTGGLTFVPFNGSTIIINGKVVEIPVNGVSVRIEDMLNDGGSHTAQSSTFYNVFASMNGGNNLQITMSLDAHETSKTFGNVGTEIAAGDDTRSFVGSVFTDASGNFQDFNWARCVRSWFNRESAVLASNPLGTNTTLASFLSEVSTNFKVQFVAFNDEVLTANASLGYINDDADALVTSQFLFDGSLIGNPAEINGDGSGKIRPMGPLAANGKMSEIAGAGVPIVTSVSFVQSLVEGSVTPVSTLTGTFAAPPTTGNWLICMVTMANGSNTPDVQLDTGDNFGTFVHVSNSTPAGTTVALYLMHYTGSGAVSLTTTFDAATLADFCCWEISGLPAVELDRQLSISQAGDGTGNSISSNQSPTLRSSNEFAIRYLYSETHAGLGGAGTPILYQGDQDGPAPDTGTAYSHEVVSFTDGLYLVAQGGDGQNNGYLFTFRDPTAQNGVVHTLSVSARASSGTGSMASASFLNATIQP